MPNDRDDRYSGVMPRVLIVLALGVLAGLVIPAACHGQSKQALTLLANKRSVLTGACGFGRLNLHDHVPVLLGARDEKADTASGDTSVGRQPLAADGTRVFAHASNIVASRPKFKYFLPLGAVGFGYLGGIIDRDPGGYKDSFRLAPDKEAHALASVVLAKAVADGTSVKVGLATCLIAGAAWEAGQSRHHGFASRYDLSFDAIGCAAGAVWGRK